MEIPPAPYSSFIQPCMCSLILQEHQDLITPCPSHHIDCPGHSITTEDAGACPYKERCPLFGQMYHMRDHKWTYLSASISLRRHWSRDSSELQRGHGRLLAQPRWMSVRFCFLQVNCNWSLLKAFEHFPGFSWFSLTVLLDNFFPTVIALEKLPAFKCIFSNTFNFLLHGEFIYFNILLCLQAAQWWSKC